VEMKHNEKAQEVKSSKFPKSVRFRLFSRKNKKEIDKPPDINKSKEEKNSPAPQKPENSILPTPITETSDRIDIIPKNLTVPDKPLPALPKSLSRESSDEGSYDSPVNSKLEKELSGSDWDEEEEMNLSSTLKQWDVPAKINQWGIFSPLLTAPKPQRIEPKKNAIRRVHLCRAALSLWETFNKKEKTGTPYFEIFVEFLEKGGRIAIGVTQESFPLAGKLPGSEQNSFGYCSFRGSILEDGDKFQEFGPSFGEGDVIGCGINIKNKSIFWSKNGHFVGSSVVFLCEISSLYPSVGFDRPAVIIANFGDAPFFYKVQSYSRYNHSYQSQQNDKTLTM